MKSNLNLKTPKLAGGAPRKAKKAKPYKADIADTRTSLPETRQYKKALR
jgi:hypothetical protein